MLVRDSADGVVRVLPHHAAQIEAARARGDEASSTLRRQIPGASASSSPFAPNATIRSLKALVQEQQTIKHACSANTACKKFSLERSPSITTSFSSLLRPPQLYLPALTTMAENKSERTP